MHQRTKPKPAAHWACGCTPDLAEHFLDVLAGQALADDTGEHDHLVAAGVDHLLAVFSRPDRLPALEDE